MGLRTLRTLVAVADTGGFSAAAEVLNITQSAVSMQMKALEEEWRMPLFDRTRRPPVLNGFGWKLVQRGRKIVEQYDALKRAELLNGANIAGTVRLGVVPTAATDLLPDVLAELQRDHPELTILARSGLSPDLVRQVRANMIDAAIVTEPDRLQPDQTARLVRTEELKLYVHRELMKADAAATLSGVPFIRFTAGTGIGQIIDTALHERAIPVGAFVEIDSVEAMLRMVRLRLGATIIPEFSVASREPDHIVALSLDPRLIRNLSLVLKHEYADSPLMAAITEAFVHVGRRRP